MIRFSHEANSWQFLSMHFIDGQWMNISPDDARWLVDRNAIINVI
jgi:hypothetical protein